MIEEKNQEQEIKKCEFPHNDQKLIIKEPVKLVRNDPYPCPECNKMLYVTIERAKMNDLLSIDVAWNLIISEEKQKDE